MRRTGYYGNFVPVIDQSFGETRHTCDSMPPGVGGRKSLTRRMRTLRVSLAAAELGSAAGVKFLTKGG